MLTEGIIIAWCDDYSCEAALMCCSVAVLLCCGGAVLLCCGAGPRFEEIQYSIFNIPNSKIVSFYRTILKPPLPRDSNRVVKCQSGENMKLVYSSIFLNTSRSGIYLRLLAGGGWF